MRRWVGVAAAVAVLSIGNFGASAQPGPPSPAALAGGSHAEAMRRLSMLDGVWAGEAVTMGPGGQPIRVWQTERIGSMLNGDVKVIEGRGYGPDGRVAFNAFGIISFNAATSRYEFRSYAGGQAGTFAFTPTADGYIWEIPAGPMTLRYTATVQGDRFREIGERVAPGQAPVQFFEMNLRRVSDTGWPSAGAVASTAGR